VRAILRELQKPESLIQHVEDRPGHDRRYALDAARAATELGWSPRRPFQQRISDTVRWYVENRGWWERLIDHEYRAYVQRQYGHRLGG